VYDLPSKDEAVLKVSPRTLLSEYAPFDASKIRKELGGNEFLLTPGSLHPIAI
jgi:hypothetical protein